MILLSNIPHKFLSSLFKNKNIKHWIYLGTRFEVREGLHQSCPEAQEINYASTLHATSNELRSEYVQWLDQIAFKIGPRREWFFSTPAVKNPYSSHILLQLSYFFTLKKIADALPIDCIIVDSPALAKLLSAEYKNKFSYPFINSVFALIYSLKNFITTILRFFKYFLDFAKRFVAARTILAGRDKSFLKKKKVVFLRNYITDTFLSASDFRQDAIEKRYFPGLYDYLEKNKHTSVFLPIAYALVSNYSHLFQKVRHSSGRIIFAEEFLRVQDFISTFFVPIKALFLRLDCPELKGYRFDSLIKEEYRANLTEFGYLYGHFLYKLGFRLKNKGITPEGIVNWAEFQAPEKGLIAGLKKNFPQMKFIASQPLLMPQSHISFYPSPQETVLNTVPDRLLTLGVLEKVAAQEFLPQMSADYTPLFRYAPVYAKSDPLLFTVKENLVVLFGYSLSNAIHTLRILIELQSELKGFRKILIKLHPVAFFDANRLVKEVGKPLPSNYQFVTDSLEDLCQNAKLGICGATGSSVELVIKGVSVISVGETHALTFNYLDKKEDPSMWQLCFSKEDVQRALRHFEENKLSADELNRKSKEFLHAFFAEPQPRYWQNYLLNEAS